MDELMNYRCIDFRKLLIVKAKKLNITDEECYILTVIMTLHEIGVKGINPNVIKDFTSYSSSAIDEVMMSLVDKKVIGRVRGGINLKPLYMLLLNSADKEENQTQDIISIFENAFGRCFSQIEINIIQNFKTQGYEDDMIVDALNEAVKAGILNFRYIEKILMNWSKYGKKQRYAPAKEKQDDQFSDEVNEYEWWKS